MHTLTQDEWNGLLEEKKQGEETPKQEPSRGERGVAIAMDALQVINGARQDRYGEPEDNFMSIAAMWTAYLRARNAVLPPLTPEDVANMMILLKMSRIVGGVYHRDNDVDLIGYALLGADMRGKHGDDR